MRCCILPKHFELDLMDIHCTMYLLPVDLFNSIPTYYVANIMFPIFLEIKTIR